MPQLPSAATSGAYHALIKTHHITSRKKVSTIKAAADKHECYALLRSGGIPGVMYVEGSQEGVASLVDIIHGLRYKDYQLIARPSPISEDKSESPGTKPTSTSEIEKESSATSGFHETDTVKEFAALMQGKGIHSWFRKAMGYTS